MGMGSQNPGTGYRCYCKWGIEAVKERSILTPSDLSKAAADLYCLVDHLPFVMTITSGKRIRTGGQNSVYWIDIRHFMGQIRGAVAEMAEESGHTPLEIKRIIAADMQPEYVGILFARTELVVHEMLKMICDIPTSTKLGTKEFHKFDERLAETMAQIIGEIRALK